MTDLRLVLAAVVMLGLAACKQPMSTGPHATVVLRDGTIVAGVIQSSSASELRMIGDDKVSRTLATTQIQSLNYDAPPAMTLSTGQSTLPATSSPGSSPLPSAPQPSASSMPPPPPASIVHEEHFHPIESAVTTKTYEVPAGTDVPVRTEETIDSKRASEGQTFPAEVTHDVRDADGNVVIPRGANATIVILSAARGGKFHGASDLVLDLASVSIDGRSYRLHTRNLERKGHDGVGVNKRTGKFAGGGAAIGAIIGAIAGGGKGAAIGAGAGAGAGGVTELATQGPAVRIPVESVLTFRLSRPLIVTPEQ